MSKELLLVVDAVANEKGVPLEVIFEAMEAALASAAKKRYPDEEPDIRVSIDQDTGEYQTFRRWEVIADDGEMESPSYQLRLMDALDERADAQVGEYIEQQVENAEFGRIAAQAAKQVIVQRVREAERQRQYKEYKDRVGEIVNGIVKRVEFGNVIVDLGRAEAIIRRDELLARETFHRGDRVRAYIYDVREETRGPQIFLSRAHPKFMAKLFAQEVPAVYDGVIEIKAVARDPGWPVRTAGGFSASRTSGSALSISKSTIREHLIRLGRVRF